MRAFPPRTKLLVTTLSQLLCSALPGVRVTTLAVLADHELLIAHWHIAGMKLATLWVFLDVQTRTREFGKFIYFGTTVVCTQFPHTQGELWFSIKSPAISDNL